jgi:two-component system, NtrC family, sensor kinase
MRLGFLDRLIPATSRDDVEAYHQGYLLVSACFLTGLFSLGYTLMGVYVGFWASVIAQGAISVMFFALPPLFRYSGSAQLVAHLFLLAGTAAVVVATYFSGGLEVLSWLAVVPIAGILLAGKRAGWIWTGIALVLTALLAVLTAAGYDFPMAMDPEKRPVWMVSVFLGLPLIIFLIARIFHAERERAFERLHARNEALAVALSDLEQAQAQLVQQEKLASLGQLTAGIAHEIKNPLNFITNFAQLNGELIGELREDVAAGAPRETLEAVLADLQDNAAKIEQHGRRADAIVRQMMAHARQEQGPRQYVDLNAFVEEHVTLAYHSHRAQHPGFEVAVERDYDPAVGTVPVVQGEMGRVLLNLLDNAFYAVAEANVQRNGQYRPTVRVETRRAAGGAEIRIRDNGPGIAPAARTRLFEPFFTTKPTGEGTGLGLSLSYDIVHRAHGGTLTVESASGEGATFVVALPNTPPG